MNSYRCQLLLMRVALTGLFLLSSSAPNAASFFDKFIDPKDGMFDTSNWVLENKGFLPVPIVITEPAVGPGLGVAALFFHESKKDDEDTNTKQQTPPHSQLEDDDKLGLPPSVSVVFGAGTNNGTWLAGGAHLGNWKQDHIRYTGALARASINISFHGSGNERDGGSGLDFNADGWYLLQEVKFRVPESNWFIGGRFDFVDMDIKFDDGDTAPGVPEDNVNHNTLAGLGALLSYDSRDNLFSPSRGMNADFEAMFHEGELIGDYSFQKYKVASNFYWDVHPHVVLGLRADGRFANGDTPFYALPFIDLRGISAMRYQGEDVLVGEFEARWNFRTRWSLVGFTGIGSAEDSFSDLFGSGESSVKNTVGAGVRYLTARRLGLLAGVDVARGPDETAVYLTVGSAWR